MTKSIKILILLFAFALSSCQFPGFAAKDKVCGPSTLRIGEHSFQIKTIKTKSDGGLKIPANKPDTAFWVNGTNTNQVFALSPTEDNLALSSSLKNGDTISVTWENCNSTKYTISDLQNSLPAGSTLLEQSVSQVTVFVRGNSKGFVAKGDLAEGTISTFNKPDPSAKQAEISLMDTSTSQDKTSINISVSVLNTGSSGFDLTENDISLKAQDGTQLAMINSDPALPKKIAVGKTENFNFSFSLPTTPLATLNILGVEYDVEGY